jgi:hypothetical protein
VPTRPTSRRARLKKPTPHPPGSPERIAGYRARAAAHLPLFVKGDNPILIRRPTSPGPRGDVVQALERDSHF